MHLEGNLDILDHSMEFVQVPKTVPFIKKMNRMFIFIYPPLQGFGNPQTHLEGVNIFAEIHNLDNQILTITGGDNPMFTILPIIFD